MPPCTMPNNAWSVLETAINNGVFSDHRFDGGDLVKIALAGLALPAAWRLAAARNP